MNRIVELLLAGRRMGASDLFLAAGKAPYRRIAGEVCGDPDAEPVAAEALEEFRRSVLAAAEEENYRVRGNADAAWSFGEGERFRLNFFRSLGGAVLAARPVGNGDELFTATLRLPEIVDQLALAPRGILLLTGSTGCGKSTTLGAMINTINRSCRKHILTIEDPIEFVHHDRQSLVTQREINSEVVSFSEALRSAMRENPDVIVIGEMRDMETMQVAVNAALTGHLVIGTVHTANAIQAVERIVNLFPEYQREQAAIDLGMALVGILSQRLLPATDGGMAPAVEILLGTPPVRKLVAERDYRGLEEAIREGGESGMRPFSRALFRLYREGTVALETAADAADNREEFLLLVHGMESGVDAFRSHYGSESGDDSVDMRRLLRSAVKMGASDLLLSIGASPTLRIHGELQALDLPVLTPGDTQRLLFSVISPGQRIEFEEKRELDFALSVSLQLNRELPETVNCRFRINGFYQRGSIGVVARVVPSAIPSPEALRIPPQVLELIRKQQGLLLFTGPTGSGKSTTQASLIQVINRSRSAHIITVEDPIEYVHENIRAVIEQRELHADTLSFPAGLKYALRQDPDVILVGEMRDIETIAAALTAAETGHLVLATLHTNSAPQTIDRIIDSFPPTQQNQIRQQLAGVLLGVVSQRLLTRRDGQGSVAAFEVMIGTAPVQALVREGKTHQLQSVIETATRDGMITMEHALEDLYAGGLVSLEEVRSLSREFTPRKAF